MATWAQNRRTVIILAFLTIVALIAFWFYASFIYDKPTCFDGERNGIEEGIDCGGACQLVCPFDATQPNILWGRAFPVADGLYNLAGIIENPNFNVAAKLNYKFDVYNRENILIEEVFGTATLAPTEKKPIFEPSVATGFQEAHRTFLDIEGETVWTKSEIPTPEVVVSSRKLTDTDTTPKLEVVISNQGITPARDLAITAILYTADGNAYQASKTFVEYVDRDSQAFAFFTWPEAFTEEVTKIDVFINTVELF